MSSLKKTARITGLLYLGVGITGMLGFLLIRPEIYVAGDAAATLANLGEREMLARLGIAFEFLVVLTQALAAVWFYKLFRTVSSTAAGSLAAFGLINSTAILSSAAFLVSALAIALDPALAPGGDAAASVELMYELSGAFWGRRRPVLRALADPDGVPGGGFPVDAPATGLDPHGRRRRLHPECLRPLSDPRSAGCGGARPHRSGDCGRVLDDRLPADKGCAEQHRAAHCNAGACRRVIDLIGWDKRRPRLTAGSSLSLLKMTQLAQMAKAWIDQLPLWRTFSAPDTNQVVVSEG